MRRQVVAGGGAQGGVELLHLLGQGSVRGRGGGEVKHKGYVKIQNLLLLPKASLQM